MTQIEEHEQAAAEYRSSGHEHEADELNQQAVVLRRLLLPDGYQLTAPVDAPDPKPTGNGDART